MAAPKAEKKERKKPVRRTAAEKAQQALDVVERKLARVTARVEEYRALYEEAQVEAQALTSERDYLAAHPALAQEDELVLADEVGVPIVRTEQTG